ncbi:hypothetical protein AB4672_05055 [Bacillus paralicheniformis]|uniref:hypothetical protein n=1 Tax=Bacillus paralicheniformis TaxID=1648923 RepID=UPI0034D37C41
MKEITHELKIKNKSRFRQRSACWKTIHDESKFKKLFVLMKQTNDYLRKQNHEDEKGPANSAVKRAVTTAHIFIDWLIFYGEWGIGKTKYAKDFVKQLKMITWKSLKKV